MSALDWLMTAASSGAAPSESSQTPGDAASKLVKRFCKLEKHPEKALKDTMATACWWKFFTVMGTRGKEQMRLLQCSLRNMQLADPVCLTVLDVF